MEPKEFTALLGQLPALSEEQRETLTELLSQPSAAAAVRELLEHGQGEPRACPHCAGTAIGAWGRAHGLARYRCRGCGRTFNVLTGTPLARLRKRERWLTYAAALAAALSVRRAAATCGVAPGTALRWRHRFLRTARTPRPHALSGIVEADETFFRRSYKGARCWARRRPEDPPPPRPQAHHRGAPSDRRGTPLDTQVPVLVARDRQRVTAAAVLPDLTATSIAAGLLPLLGPEVVLCTDASRAYGAIARQAGLHHEAVNVAAGERVRDGVFHLQNINAYHSRLKDWMHRFRGVATRHLPSYLGWRQLLERLGPTINPQAVLLNCL